MNTKKRWWTAKEDRFLRECQKRGIQHRDIANLLGRTHASVDARSCLLRRGLRSRPWSEEEDNLLRTAAGYRSAASIGAELGRTAGAVNTRASTLGIRWGKPNDRTRHTGFTATEVARLLGVKCSKAVVDWIEKGYLAGTRRAIRLANDPQQTVGRCVAWRIMPDALRQFLRDYPWLYERDRIQDRGWAAYVATLPRETYIGTREAARRLYCTEANVNKMIRLGQLRAEKQGANWRIPLSAIQTYQPPPMGGQPGKGVRDEVARQRAANLAARKTQGYHSRPETVARQVAGRARRRQAA